MEGSKDNLPGVLVIPCSGIGKVQGLISRESVYLVTDRRMPEETQTVCLALLVSGDAAARELVQDRVSITVDGCPKLCARKNVELSGGKVVAGVRVFDTLKRRRGATFGSATSLAEEGWSATEEVADEICRAARQALDAPGKE